MKASNKVLIIEDDRTISAIVAVALRKRGYDPLIVSQFEHALDILNHNQFSFVISDIFMPGMGGLEGIKQLKHQLPDLPVIAMSGGWSGMKPEKVIEAAKKIGADAGVKKPMSVTSFDMALSAISRGERFDPS